MESKPAASRQQEFHLFIFPMRNQSFLAMFRSIYRKYFEKAPATFFCCIILLHIPLWSHSQSISCDSLLPGQYLCDPPEIDSITQQPVGCTENNVAPVQCVAAVKCDGIVENGTFTKLTSCRYTTGKDFKTALLLSVFFGWLGLDRFYLGYFAVGFFKLFTFGFFFLFHLVDIILIALQIVGPADGSGYVIDYYGPKATYIGFTNSTSIVSATLDYQAVEL